MVDFDFEFFGIGIRTIDKAPMLAGQPITIQRLIQPGIRTVQMAQAFDSPDVAYGVSFNTTTTATISAITDPIGNAGFVSIDVPVPEVFLSPERAPNGGGMIDLIGSNACNCQVRGGKLYTTHAVRRLNRSVIQWYEFDLQGWPETSSPTLTQSGTIDMGPGSFAFFPAIYSDELDNVAVVYGSSSEDNFISVNAVGRRATDPIGTMSVPVVLDVSTAPADGRYGDYFDISVDPVEPGKFWVSGQIQFEDGWTTTIGSFRIIGEDSIGDVNMDGSVNLLDIGPFIEIISNGQYMLEADINEDGVVNLLDVGSFIELLAG